MNMTISLCVMYDVLCIVCYVFCVMFTCGVCFVCFVWCVFRFFFSFLCFSFWPAFLLVTGVFSFLYFLSLLFSLHFTLGLGVWDGISGGIFFFLMALGLVGVWDWNGNGNGKWHGCLDT